MLYATFISTAYGIVEIFKEKVKTQRKKIGMAQKGLAREVDVNLSTAQRCEGKGFKTTRPAHREAVRLYQEPGISD